jgi:hypothetical protein
MATIPDVIVPTSGYIDLYSAAGLATGTPIEIINKGTSYIHIQESTTRPDDNSIDGVLITPLNQPWAVTIIEVGSDTVWVRSSTMDGRVSVVDVS